MRPHVPDKAVRYEATTSTVTCTLTTEGAAEQVNNWEQVVRKAAGSTPLANGIHMTFPAELAGELQRLAASESTCCSFLTIEVKTTSDKTSVTITTEAEDGQSIIALIAGLAPSETASP